MKEKLQNPVWSALNETHKPFALEYKGVNFYKSDVCNFGAIFKDIEVANSIDKYAETCQDFYVVGKKPIINESLVLKKEIACHQMVLEKETKLVDTSKVIKLDASYIDRVYDLVWLSMPGYYKKKAFNLGCYYGVVEKGKLVAVAGERLQSDFFIEISAVVTHPDFRGKGYAKQLVMYAAENILKQNKKPILHVAENNTEAINLYKKLGFKIVQKIVWRHYNIAN